MTRSSPWFQAIALLCSVLACNKTPAPPASDKTSGDTAPGASTAASPAPAPDDIDPPMARTLRANLVAGVRAEGPPWGRSAWDERVLDALRKVPRHLFAPGVSLSAAYEDRPQPIGHGQTISQPTVVAVMTNALNLRGTERVLEIGTGSGYQAAVLSLLAREVFTVEIVEPLGRMAKERLAKHGYSNVEVHIGDGYAGWPERAPFDRILLTAAPPEIPRALVDQLAEGGVLVAPVGDRDPQMLVRWTKRGGRIEKEDLGEVRFVPMVPGTGSPR